MFFRSKKPAAPITLPPPTAEEIAAQMQTLSDQIECGETELSRVRPAVETHPEAINAIALKRDGISVADAERSKELRCELNTLQVRQRDLEDLVYAARTQLANFREQYPDLQPQAVGA